MPRMLDGPTITDTSPLVYLHRIGKLDILKELYGEVIVPEAVVAELKAGELNGFAVPDPTQFNWFKIRKPKSSLILPAVVDLGAGEVEAMGLAAELQAHVLIVDDIMARNMASLLSLNITGTAGVMQKAFVAGLITDLKAALHDLRDQGLWITDAVIATVLARSPK